VLASQHRQYEVRRAFREHLAYVSDEEWEGIADAYKLSEEIRRAVLAEYRALGAAARQEP